MNVGARGARWGAAAFLLVPSGAAALAHEAAWARLWTPWSGAGVATSSAVVAGVLLGLAVGSALGGRLSARSRRPALLFAAAEGAGALLAVLVPIVAAWAKSLDEAGATLGSGPRLALVAFASFLPFVPLGASLPALVRAIGAGPETAGRALGGLYAANTLGAVVGVLLATAWGIERLGLTGTIRVAAAIQAAVAVGGLFLAGGTRQPYIVPPLPDPQRTPRGLALAAFLAGAAGLLVQVAWMRRLLPALGTTSYAFGTVLAAHLAAVALGAALLGPRRTGPAGRMPTWVLALAALPVVLLVPAVAPVARMAASALAAALEEGAATPARLLAIRGFAAAVVLVPATVLGASALPWLVHAARPSSAESGRAAGALLAANSFGSALAAVLAGVLLVPALGTAGTLLLAGAVYLVAAGVAASGRLRGGLLLAGFALAGIAAARGAEPPLLGPDVWARDAVGATFDPAGTDPAAAPATFFEEGRVSTVVVRDRDGRPELWVDGKVVASASPTDRFHLALLGHLPLLVHPRPRRVAVIALGTGITATACADHAPEVLDVFELEGEVARAAEAFAPARGGLPPSARLHVVDGRYGILRTDTPYDVVTTDPVHPAAAGSAELYTLEHYRLVASRLAEDGVACQWLPLYELSPEDVGTVLATFSAVFETAVFVAGPDLVILGKKQPWRLDPDAIEARITGPVRASLAPLGFASASRLLGLLLASPERTKRLAEGMPLATDDRPVLEFSSARSQYTGSPSETLTWLSLAPSPPKDLLARESGDAAAFEAGVERARRSRRAFAHWIASSAPEWERALGSFEVLAASDPDDGLSASMREELRVALARAAAGRGEREPALAWAREVLASPVAEDRQRVEAAEVLADLGEADEARAAARDVLTRVPGSPRARRLAEPAR